MKTKKRRSLGTTVLISMLVLIAVVLVLVIGSTAFSMIPIQRDLTNGNTKLGEKAREISVDSMEEEVTARLVQTATSRADIVDSNFGHFKATVELLASDATYLYEHADEYANVKIEEPRAENDGKLVVHMTHSESTNMSDPAVTAEAGLLGNEQNTLISAHAGNPSMAKCYIATESGLMIEADEASSDKLNKDGTVAFYEAAKRPWYYETKEAGATHFTNITPEASGKRIGMMCGSPITKNGQFMGVACAGMYLDDVDALVNSTELGENGIACIINNQGQLLFSSDKSGVMTVTKETADFDLRQSENTELAQLVTDALSGREGYRTISYNNDYYYVAFAHMETVGWSFVIMLPAETVMASTVKLMEGISTITDETEAHTRDSFSKMILCLLVIGVLAILIASATAIRMSRTIVAPMQKLTGKVQKIQGENLDFEWDEVKDDEIQTLAESFGTMTVRMKQYIEEVTKVTAEKERIGAELSLATKIQANMLPNIFPPFPERTDFDIYATMTPAKEVGGDFYDFFLIDDDHLGIVMADVSGKGVPAALFMMMSKILLNNYAMIAGPNGSPAQVLAQTNEAICKNNEEEMFVTVWFGILTISTGRIVAANAGHEYPILKSADGDFEILKDNHGFVIGGMEGMSYSDYEFILEKGGVLFLYTDGVAEATDANEELFGTDRTIQALNEKKDASMKELLVHVKESVDAFVGEAPQFDDLTMLSVRLTV